MAPRSNFYSRLFYNNPFERGEHPLWVASYKRELMRLFTAAKIVNYRIDCALTIPKLFQGTFIRRETTVPWKLMVDPLRQGISDIKYFGRWGPIVNAPLPRTGLSR